MSTLSELGFLHVLEHYPLAAFLRHHAIIVRQVVGRGLHAVIAIARVEDFVDHANRRCRAQLRVAILRFDREIVLDLLQVPGKCP